MPVDPAIAELRLLAFEASVVRDLDVVPTSEGVLVQGDVPVEVSWSQLRDTVSEAEPTTARGRIGALLWQVRALTSISPKQLAGRTRPVGLPVRSGTSPGGDWRMRAVLGGALDLGLGVLGLHDDPDHVDVVVPGALAAMGEDPVALWPSAERYLEHMGGAAARRVAELDPTAQRRHAVLRPVGDVDVVTLLGSAAYRRALADRDGSGMCAVAVPMRRRGWIDLRALDPAFVPAAYAATDPAERGFPRPVLVTADEVTVGGPAA